MTIPAVHVPSDPPQPRPALRLVKTNDLDREQWLDVRRRGIGSSDAAAAVGLNPYQSQLELWMQKTGLEWFYRFLQEPRRMFRRYFIEDMAFFGLLIKEWANRGSSVEGK